MSIAVVDLLQELTDIDTLHESEEGAEVLIDALVSSTSLWGFAGVCTLLASSPPLSLWVARAGCQEELCGKAGLNEESKKVKCNMWGTLFFGTVLGQGL